MSAVMEKTPSRPHSRNKAAHNQPVETRLAVLEACREDIIPTLATKADLGDLRTELHKMDAGLIRWMLTTAVALFVGIAGMLFAQQRSLDNAISRLERLYATTQTVPTEPSPATLPQD